MGKKNPISRFIDIMNWQQKDIALFFGISEGMVSLYRKDKNKIPVALRKALGIVQQQNALKQ